jgi:5,10-methenyltetrahydrofolate synthetase
MQQFDYQEARCKYRALRVQLHAESQLDACLGDALMQWLTERRVECVGFYWPVKGEPDLRGKLSEAVQQRVIDALAMPVIQSCTEGTMRFAFWTPTTRMHKSVFGLQEIAEPIFVEPDVIIAPCVAMNSQGFRLGNGGGYYDRYLAKACGKSVKETIAVGYEQLLLEEAFQREHDMPFDWLLTETGIRRTRRQVY